MKHLLLTLIFVALLVSCSIQENSHNYSQVDIEIVYEDTMSIRAIEFLDDKTLAFAGNKGLFGTVDVPTGRVRANVQQYDSITPEFRAVAHTTTNFFMLSVSSPALLYKTDAGGQMKLVYKEEGKGVFYDAMKFWNDQEGIAIGDTVDGCFSIIITRDGGSSWNKIPCSQLPEGIEGEGAFAASNSNIAIAGDKVWVVTTSNRMYYSPDKGKSWESLPVPSIYEANAEGLYSIDFYDKNIGFAIGGDYTKPENNDKNKIKTVDGGKTWQLVANGQAPNFRSCVQYVPNGHGKDLVAIGFKGLDYSSDGGTTWKRFFGRIFLHYPFSK